MKAIAYRRFGGVEVLGLEDLPDPKVADLSVLVAMRAATLNVIDIRSRNGAMSPFVDKKFPKIPGVDVSGIVVATGAGAKRFKIGDEVFGAGNAFKGGAFAERVAVDEAGLAAKPPTMDFASAATLPTTGLAALYALRELGGVKPGTRVLIYGSSGAAGLFAIQLAKYFGARVTAVCGTAGVALSKAMGADEVIDYRSGAPSLSSGYEVIIDFSSVFPFAKARSFLSAAGRFVEASPSIPKFIGSLLANPFRRQKHLMLQTTSKAKDLEFLVSLYQSGALKVTIARQYPLKEAKAAFQEQERGGVVGKIVVTAGE